MNFSALSSSEKMTVYVAVVVLATGLFSIANDWGYLLIVPVAGALGILLVLLSPQTLAGVGSKSSLLFISGAAAGVIWVIVALTWLSWIGDHLGTFDTIQFLVGMVLSIYLAWVGWQAFQADGGKLQIGAPKP